jgi:hypothetical protein
MTDEVLEQQVDEIETYYCDDLNSLISEQNAKEFGNRCKAVETLLKASNQSKQLELEREKWEYEKEQLKQQQELDKRKVDLEAERVKNEKAKVEADIKDQKKTFWTTIAKILVTLFGTIAGIFLTIWSVTTSMKFEETGSVRSSVGKFALNFCQKTLAKLDRVKTD